MIVTVEMSEDVSAGDLLSLYTNTPNVSVSVARPKDKNNFLSILADTYAGFNRDALPVEQPGSTVVMEALLFSRLTAHDTTHIIVTHCERIPTESLTRLALLADATNTELILAYGIDAGENVREWALGFTAADLNYESVTWPASVTEPVKDVKQIIYPELPAEEFMTFRYACRQHLNETDFALVDALYVASFTYAHQHHTRDEEEAVNLINGLLPTFFTEEEATIAIRAFQAAYLHLGSFLQVDLSQLLPLISSNRTLKFEDKHWALLRETPETGSAAIAALLHEGYTAEACDELSIFTKLAANTTAEVFKLHRAHQIVAAITDPNDKFVNGKPVRWLKKTQHDLRNAGLEIRTPTPLKGNRNQRWNYKYGLNIQEVTL